jgi:DNA repair protein SbcC/Rad50
MVTKSLFRTAPHQDADPARRLIGVADLPTDSAELASLLTEDSAPEVRLAAANRCSDATALAVAWTKETDPAVRFAIASALGTVLGATVDGARAMDFLGSNACTDEIRADVARRTTHTERRRAAIAAIREEAALIDLALTAPHAETRMAAAERVQTPEGLRHLADAAENKDRGVARHARKRMDAIARREGGAAEADAILDELEALANKPGPVLSAVVELNRRWEALKLADDPARLARCDAAREALQARFESEHEEQRARARFERGLNEWLAKDAPASSDALAGLLAELVTLREAAGTNAGAATLKKLDEADQRIERWTQELNALAGAESLVVEAEQLAAGTSIDNAKLPERWQSLDRSVRTPALTARFEAALIQVEQRRLAQIRAAKQETDGARLQVHGLLHAAEQALAAGQLQAARSAVDEIRARKVDAGVLPKPTLQRIGRVTQQLTELERWESFGQHQARVQLCERAEAAATLALAPPRLAVEVKHLREEWKRLDLQHADVPKALWERFDHACEKAYAPAARHFAEQAAARKQVRKQREEFIAAAAAHAPTLLAEPRDWRAIERWLRETDQKWRDGDLGSVEPKAWKSFDTQFRAALAPARDALAAARDEAKARRVALIEEASALSAKAMERDTPGQVKAIQARWQAQAKELSLAQRDERALWEQFRAACDAVFQARESKRKQEDDQKHEGRRALEEICAALDALAQSTDKEDQDLRRGMRDLTEQWKQKSRGSAPVPRGLESRFTNAKAAVEAALSARTRSREAAVWQTLAAKERLCESLDVHVLAETGSADAARTVTEQWAALPGLPAAWEKAMLARRDAAIHALGDKDAAAKYSAAIEESAAAREESVLEMEMQLNLAIPQELQAMRLALQVRKLRNRFQDATKSGADTPAERLVAWCAQSGFAETQERGRIDRVFAAMEKAR